MKFSIKVDCTPEEARRFLGLPDLKSFHDEVTEHLKERTMAQMKSLDPEEILKSWMPFTMENVAAMQKAFMRSVTDVGGAGSETDDRKPE